MVAALGLGTLEIDGLDLRTYGYNVSTRTGRYFMPAFRGEDPVLPGRSGYTFVGNKAYEAGEGTLAVWADAHVPATGALASTMTARRTQFEANMMLLQRVFTRRHRLSVIRASQPDGTIRRAFVQWTGWDEPEVQMGGLWASWSIHYSIPKVFWEDDAGVISQSTAASATLPQTLDLTSFANMTGIIEDAQFTVAGPITNPRITDVETGAYVQLSGSVPGGSNWLVDVDLATSNLGVNSVLTSTVHVGGYRMLVIPNIFNNTGTPRLLLSGTAGSTTTNLTVVARRKWVTG